MIPQEQPDSQDTCPTCGKSDGIETTFCSNLWHLNRPDTQTPSKSATQSDTPKIQPDIVPDSQAGDDFTEREKLAEWIMTADYNSRELREELRAYAERLATRWAIKEIDDFLFNYGSLIVAGPRQYLTQRKAELKSTLTKETEHHE